MPWCEDCSKYWNPSSMNVDGTCPRCGRKLAEPEAQAPLSPPLPEGATPFDAKSIDVKKLAGKEGGVPWHFKLLVAALVVYLGWRVVQLVLAIL